jgi:hypothetical protein
MTARVAVVSDNPGLGFGLSGGDLEVVGIDPAEVDEWVMSRRCDVLVIGLADPAKALDVVVRARASAQAVPLLLVSSDAPGWDSLRQLDDDALDFLTLPITGPSFVEAVSGLLSRVHAPPEASAVATPEPDVAVVIEPEPVAPPPQPPSDPLPEPASAPVPALSALTDLRRPVALRQRLAGRQLSSRDEDIRASIVLPSEPPRRRAARDRHTPVAPLPAQRPVEQGSAERDVPALVRGVLSKSAELVDIRDAATAVVAEATELIGAAAGALLLPDGDVWRVSGAVGLRPLELRYSLAPDCWLVTTVVHSTKGVIVEDSDIARQRLGGAPLSHRPYLLAAPVTGVDGLILLARDDVPFVEKDLWPVVELARKSATLLDDALAVRALARSLRLLADED